MLIEGTQKQILLDAQPGVEYNLKSLLGWIDNNDPKRFEKLFFRDVLYSRKHFNEVYFRKEASFIHLIRNDYHESLNITINEFFPFYMQPYTKDMKITLYKPRNDIEDDENFYIHAHSLVPNNYASYEYTGYGFEFEKYQIGLLFRYKNITLQPNEVMTLTLSVKKRMIGVEKIPVDISMDANVPPLPIQYHSINKTSNFSGITYSQSWLVTLLEPDFSMTFNINAMTFGVFGILINYLYYATIDVANFF